SAFFFAISRINSLRLAVGIPIVFSFTQYSLPSISTLANTQPPTSLKITIFGFTGSPSQLCIPCQNTACSLLDNAFGRYAKTQHCRLPAPCNNFRPLSLCTFLIYS